MLSPIPPAKPIPRARTVPIHNPPPQRNQINTPPCPRQTYPTQHFHIHSALSTQHFRPPRQTNPPHPPPKRANPSQSVPNPPAPNEPTSPTPAKQPPAEHTKPIPTHHLKQSRQTNPSGPSSPPPRAGAKRTHLPHPTPVRMPRWTIRGSDGTSYNRLASAHMDVSQLLILKDVKHEAAPLILV